MFKSATDTTSRGSSAPHHVTPLASRPFAVHYHRRRLFLSRMTISQPTQAITHLLLNPPPNLRLLAKTSKRALSPRLPNVYQQFVDEEQVRNLLLE
jgi:hypothetical protein